MDLDLLLLLDLDLLEDLFSLVKGDLRLFLEGCCCWDESVGGVGGLAFTGVLIGAEVGIVVEGFGEMDVGVELVVVGGTCGGEVNVDFSEAAIDSILFSMLFSKVAPKRCSKACRSKACRSKFEGLVEGGCTPCVGDVVVLDVTN